MQGSLRGNKGPRIRHVVEEGAPFETITVDKVTPVIGAEVGNIDLSKPLSNRQQDEIHRALAENCVIFFRDQHISPDQHLAFGRLFGDLHVHPAAPHEPGKPELMIIHADKDSPRANGEGWHSDVSCDVEPPMGSILYIKQCPPKGGDTLFANMYAAYEALSDGLKATLDGLVGVSSSAKADVTKTREDRMKEAGAALKVLLAEHPIVRTHPETGRKALYLNANRMEQIVGLERLDRVDPTFIRAYAAHFATPTDCKGAIAFPLDLAEGHIRDYVRAAAAGAARSARCRRSSSGRCSASFECRHSVSGPEAEASPCASPFHGRPGWLRS